VKSATTGEVTIKEDSNQMNSFIDKFPEELVIRSIIYESVQEMELAFWNSEHNLNVGKSINNTLHNENMHVPFLTGKYHISTLDNFY
jgi:hypothetical protein